VTQKTAPFSYKLSGISQRTEAIPLRCGGFFNYDLTTNLVPSSVSVLSFLETCVLCYNKYRRRRRRKRRFRVDNAVHCMGAHSVCGAVSQRGLNKRRRMIGSVNYASWYEAGSKLVADRFEAGRRPASNLSATSFEPASNQIA